MNNSLSAHRQVLIKKSGRTIEHLAPNSEVVNLKCFSTQVAFIYPFICLKKQNKKDNKQGQDILKLQASGDLFPGAALSFTSRSVGRKG